MNDISVIIYSYKGKMLKDVINSLRSNSSGSHRISVKVIDQNPIKRKELFEEQLSCTYSHMFWDWINSPIGYKKFMIQESTEEYVLLLSDNILVGKDWDKKLIDFVSNKNAVVSGNSKARLYQEGHFFIKSQPDLSDEYRLSQFVSRDFIFGRRSIFTDQIHYPEYLKYNGENEVISIEMFTSGIDIFSGPSSLYISIGQNTLDELYVPFSVNHNYNEAIRLIKSGVNKFASVQNRPRSIDDFNMFHNNIFLNISELPFLTNDVDYDPQNLNFNSVDARRFVARTKAIH